MKKELGIFIFLFIFLSLGMHFKQWLDHPIEHLMSIQAGGAFGIPGFAHPFVFTFLAYLVVGIPRVLGKLFSSKK